MTSGKRPGEPAQAARMAHSSTLSVRHPPSSPDNTPRTRKPKSKKKREDRYEEEIQYNLSYDFRGAGSRRHAQSSRMLDDADYPPPPTYESATAVSTLVSENFVHQAGPPHPSLPSPAVTVASLPVSGHSAGSDRSDTLSINTASLSLLQPPHEAGDGCSIELVDLELSERWELDRARGIPLDERVKRHKLRAESTVRTGPPVLHRTRLASQPTVSRGPGSQARFLASQLSLRIPESRDRYEDDQNQDNNSDLSTPPTPKHHRTPSIPGSSSRIFHGRSHSPQPSSSVISLLRNPSPFFKSTPSLLNLSPSHHGTTHRARARLFHRKSKERASSEPLEDWEMLERTGSGESSVDGSLPPPSPPATPQNRAMRRLPKSTTVDVLVTPPRLPANRSRKVNTVQMPQVGSQMNRPASPPFVARHVRRHTTSSRGSQMSASSAPVSPISVASTATFDTCNTSISQNTIDDEDVPETAQAVVSREVASEPPRPVGIRHESSLTSRTPRVSSLAPSAPAYEHDPDLPILQNPGLGSLPTRSATERIVRPPDTRDDNHALVRGRSLSRDTGIRSAPAYSSIFPSGPPTPLPNMTQSLPPQTTQPSPRRHYPGRPLPATPPVSPSLTWILDKSMAQSHIAPPHKTTVSVAPSTPPIPEGLLIDLDDDSLDKVAQLNPNPVAPLVDILGLDDDNGDGNDNASDSGTVSPPGPLTPTTSYYASATSLTLSTADMRSMDCFDTSMQTTPTSDVSDMNGLMSSLDEQGMSDGTNYDALLLIADLLGPATPPPPPAANTVPLPPDADCDADADVGEKSLLGDEEETRPPSYLVGKVELLRRRATRDGQIKLKMNLLDVAVEKCAICMTQFKPGDEGILGATCHHAFHETCLETWLDRSQTCPLCREQLGPR